MKKLVYGVGINSKSTKTRDSIKNIHPTYTLWINMLRRCYSDKYQEKKPTYKRCTVSNNFKDYSFFYNWCQYQVGFGKKGYQIDKDILVRGNSLYSEDLCVFVPSDINTILTKRQNHRGVFPIGVGRIKRERLFRVSLSKNGKPETVTGFETENDAFLCYKKMKEEFIKEMANKYINEIDPRAYNALIGYEVCIDD